MGGEPAPRYIVFPHRAQRHVVVLCGRRERIDWSCPVQHARKNDPTVRTPAEKARGIASRQARIFDF
ncbi:hypothetical protein DYB28_011621 [Aphanomyces astaci]|uniref:Uncharacterized protein n=1 Tax=Aphanomyces astaci TaxID=112090 RepID=A0A9X8E9U2_APHAT|nr:hypothetical protein DYB28_011621 [Aphanomyces astaci]